MPESLGYQPDAMDEKPEGEPISRLELVQADLKELGVFPYQIIQGGRAYEIDRDFYNGRIFSEAERPFTVAEVVDIGESSNEHSSIYKLGPEPGDGSYVNGLNEIVFLRDIAPDVYQQFPPDLQEKADFPTISQSCTEPDRPTYLVENMFKGKLLGTIHEASPDLITPEDMETIVEFIDTFGKYANLNERSVTDLDVETRSAYDHFKKKFNSWSSALAEHLGQKAYQQAADFLEQSKEVFDRTPTKLVAGDINPTNIIKQENGKIGFFDWERLNRVNDPSSDYAFLFIDLFHSPELQEQLYRSAAARNNEDFPICFRANMLCNRGIGELNYWTQLKKSSEDPAVHERADFAIERIKAVLVDALNGTGIWGEPNPPQVSG